MKQITFDFDNLGGLAEIYAIPPSSFVRVRQDYIKNRKVLEVKNREDIIAIPMFADDTFSFSEEHKRDDGGDYYQPTIEGVIPKIALENEEIIETLERGEWMVLSQDHNGVVHLSGNEDVLMTFSSNSTTTAAKNTRNQIAFKFECKSAEPSPILFMDDLMDI